ncbi:Gfo/Idh/MocA family protein [Pontibacter liquoris]|uniref:Gfo/Idh/MocA family protein n=1 Tax=Pontibacter liquoris TaxID=2905677 RepID=UPI001FA741C1|nr:Gfo/Idh/MocA family oxidoreductase [Pontibacter liquoris]
MEEIRWGIIGCGDVVERKSGPAFQQVADSKLVAVMRRDAALAADFAARHQVPKWYSQAEELLHDPDINAVYVATPPASHEAYTLAALAAGKHVYLEKPMTLAADGARRILAQAAESTGKLVIAHYRRAQPAFLKIKELLENGSIGQPLFAESRLLQPLQPLLVATTETNWRLDPAISGGGLFHDLAPHQLDLMVYYFGEIARASGFSANQRQTAEVDDFVSGLIQFKSGVQFQGLWHFGVPPEETTDTITITGTKGKLTFSCFGETDITLWQNGQKTTYPFQRPTYVQQPMIEKVVGYFLNRNPNPCPAAEAVVVMRLLDAFTGKETYEPAGN